MANTLTEIRNL